MRKMPLLTPLQSEVIWSFIMIAYGIWKERHYVALSTAVINLAGFLMVLATFDLPEFLPPLLLTYIGLGALAAHTKTYALMELVGSKPYGSLTLALGLYGMGFLAPIRFILASINDTLGTEAGTIITAWVIFAVASHLLMRKLMQAQQEGAIA